MGFMDSQLRTFAHAAERLGLSARQIGNAAETAAVAYAKKCEQPNIVVNTTYDPSFVGAEVIEKAVMAALRKIGVQDR